MFSHTKAKPELLWFAGNKPSKVFPAQHGGLSSCGSEEELLVELLSWLLLPGLQIKR